MKILLIGNCGIMYALAWIMARTPKVEKIYCVPGNTEIADFAECVDIALDNVSALLDFAKKQAITATFIGLNESLTARIVGIFKKEGLNTIDPCKVDDFLDGSKSWVRVFMQKYKILIERQVFTGYDDAKMHIYKSSLPMILKPKGLNSKEGVIFCKTYLNAVKALEDILVDGIFGKANEVVIINQARC